MLSEELLQRAKKIALADINYGHKFRDALFLDNKEATKYLQAGDMVIQYIPQLDRDIMRFNELILKGCMHIGIIAEFGAGNIFKMELWQKGLFCDESIFSLYEWFDVYLKRYHFVIRS